MNTPLFDHKKKRRRGSTTSKLSGTVDTQSPPGYLEKVWKGMWPKDQLLSVKICIFLVNLLHICILLFMGTGWLLIPPKYQYLQIIYIALIIITITLFLCLNKCILQNIKEWLYEKKELTKKKQFNIFPLRKKTVILIWSVFLMIGLWNYIVPEYSVFCLVGRYFNCS